MIHKIPCIVLWKMYLFTKYYFYCSEFSFGCAESFLKFILLDGFFNLNLVVLFSSWHGRKIQRSHPSFIKYLQWILQDLTSFQIVVKFKRNYISQVFNTLFTKFYKFLVVQVNSSLLGFCQFKHSNFKSLTYFMALNLHIQVTKMKNYTCENNDNELLHEVLAIKMGSNGSSCHVVR